MIALRMFSALAVLLAGCVSSGTRPHDMSVAQHRAEAARNEVAANKHMEQSRPSSYSRACRSTGGGGPTALGGVQFACWTSVRTAVQEHEERARRLHEIAAKHRAAADALVDAETRACAGLSESDRDLSPFYHREDIASAEPLEDSVPVGKTTTRKLVGAIVVFRAVPGLTAKLLQRLVNCHMARAAALGHDVPEMNYCPLMLNRVEAHVSSTGDGFAVAISSREPATANEVLRRAQALPAPAAPSPRGK